MKTKSTPCFREAHEVCSGCYCACHPLNFDDVVDEVFDDLRNDTGYAYLHERQRIKDAHIQSFRHDTFDSSR